MIYYYFLDGDWLSVMTSFGILTSFGAAIMIACAIDLGYGIKNSKKAGLYTHSNGLKMTIRKIIEYLSLLLLGFLFDAVNPLFYHVWKLPGLLPASAVVTGFAIFTEYVSVKEHLSEGRRAKFKASSEEAGMILEILKELKDEIRK